MSYTFRLNDAESEIFVAQLKAALDEASNQISIQH